MAFPIRQQPDYRTFVGRSDTENQSVRILADETGCLDMCLSCLTYCPLIGTCLSNRHVRLQPSTDIQEALGLEEQIQVDDEAQSQLSPEELAQKEYDELTKKVARTTDTTIISAREEFKADMQKAKKLSKHPYRLLHECLMTHIESTLHDRFESNSNIFKLQLLSAFGIETQEQLPRAGKHTREILEVLKSEFKAIAFRWEPVEVRIHEKQDSSSIITPEKIHLLNDFFQKTIQKMIQENEETRNLSDEEGFENIPKSCIAHLKRNTGSNTYYIDDKKDNGNPALVYKEDKKEFMDDLRVFIERLQKLANNNTQLIKAICQYITEDLSFTLIQTINHVLAEIFGESTQLSIHSPNNNIRFSCIRIPLSEDEFAINMTVTVSPQKNSICTDAFSSTLENINTYRSQWNSTIISGQLSLNISSSNPDTVMFDPLELNIYLP